MTEEDPEEIVRSFVRHVTSDERHLKRIDGDIFTELLPPLKKIVEARLFPEYANRNFLIHIGKERKIVGHVSSSGRLVPVTLYGRGNPVDKARGSVDLTSLVITE